MKLSKHANQLLTWLDHPDNKESGLLVSGIRDREACEELEQAGLITIEHRGEEKDIGLNAVIRRAT